MSLSKLHNQIEATIARYLISQILAEGLLVSLQNEEGFEIRKSNKERAILDAMAATDIDWVRVTDPVTCQRVGSFMLIYGNGEDLLSDYTANPFCDRIGDKVFTKFS